ncbi:MAG TPA: patatin-like phospholipase family protein [Rhodanobacteraceae bacterium]|nr:patatin-like phospholipase family protein [Rhodanobacteraceae bacterium]
MPPALLDTQNLLRRNLVFGHLSDVELRSVEREMAAMSVPGGQLLFARGEPPDALYVLKSGSLGAFLVPEAGGAPQLVSLVDSGQTIGAFGMLTRQERAFDLRALRDSELLRLPREGFDALIREHPQAILGAAQLALERLLEENQNPPTILPHTFAVLPFDHHVPVRELAEQLRHALQPYGDCLLIDAATGKGHDSGWFAEREHEVRFVLYVDEGADPLWRELCRRQADALLLVVNAGRREEAWPDRAALDEHAAWERPRYLLLQHPGADILPGAARRWHGAFTRPVRQHHVRSGQQERDLARLARLLTRHSTGLVFSGGGARGFAAIGVVRALREAGIEIDAVGGTSIGAIIGAGVAMEWDDARLYQTYKRAFVDGRPLSDRTFPLVALSRGRRTVNLLREVNGEHDIEDLPLSYFCVVSNLTSGRAEIRHAGRLWFWLRASSAIPGILPPVLHRGQVYVDGAVINNLPTDVMRDTGVANIIACDISADDAVSARIEECFLPSAWQVLMQSSSHVRPGLLPILLRAGMVNTEAASVRRRELADRLLTPALSEVGLLDWKAYDHAIEAGYRHTRRALEDGTWQAAGSRTMGA